MIVTLCPGDELIVQLEGTDGEFRVHFDSKTYPNAIAVEETSGLSDDKKRNGILYREVFHEYQPT